VADGRRACSRVRRCARTICRGGDAARRRGRRNGDAAARLFPLPRLPIVIVINKSEEGLPAAANLMYDRSATDLLPLEDLVVLAELVSHKLSNVAKERGILAK